MRKCGIRKKSKNANPRINPIFLSDSERESECGPKICRIAIPNWIYIFFQDPAFKRYFYLLESFAYVKSFNMICELEDCNEICLTLFTNMFKLLNDEHSSKVKKFILDILCPLISDSDGVSNELLDVILTNIVEPVKTQRKYAYNLARELVIKTSEHLEPYIQQFFNHVLILGKDDDKLFIKNKVYDLIYELNHICPSILLAVLPQLEFKIKSTDEKERMGSVALLAKMFSEPNSTLAARHKALWQVFLGRFNDISVAIRIKCVQYTMHFLVNHPRLIEDITEALKARQHDPEESVRFEVVNAIFATAKKDFEVVSSSEDLLTVVKVMFQYHNVKIINKYLLHKRHEIFSKCIPRKYSLLKKNWEPT